MGSTLLGFVRALVAARALDCSVLPLVNITLSVPRRLLAPLLAALVVGALSCLLSPVAEAAPLGVRVRGSAKITVRTTREQAGGISEVVFAGTLTDDAGEALPLQTVNIHVARQSDANDEQTTIGVRAARGCDGEARAPTAWGARPGGANEVVVVTDEGGRFCFRARLPPDRYRASLVYRPAPSSLVDGVEREATFDLSRRNLLLRFDPVPRVVQLDDVATAIEAVAIVQDSGEERVQAGLTIVLANETKDLATLRTDAAGRARFSLATEQLGPPGRGELRLSFAGDTDTVPAVHIEEIERHVAVRLRVPALDGGETSIGVPEDGMTIEAEVDSSRGPVGEGVVEARLANVVVGAARVDHGRARLDFAFSSPDSEAIVALRYVPAAPWLEPLGDVPIRVHIRGPSFVSKLPILAAGVAMLLFFLAGRISGKKSKTEPVAPPTSERDDVEPKPRIEVIRPAKRGEQAWTGRVVDAHEGRPVPRARVWIERGTFEGRAVLGSVETDADGRFALRGIETTGGERLAVEGRLHSRFVQDLPPAGELAIAVSARRRTVLAKLVAWARRRGAPFDAHPEPTPGHIRNAAGDDGATGRWASAVEHVAFGPSEVDARLESEVEALAPDLANRGSPRGESNR